MIGITPSHFPVLMNMAIFGHFFLIHSQGIEQTKNILFICFYLWCSNNLKQKLTSITLSINEINHLKVLFKTLLNIFTNFKVIEKYFTMSGPFKSIPFICFRDPCLAGLVQKSIALCKLLYPNEP
jgi:hypothetical protein